MIAYSVCILLKLPPTKTQRVVFHEITERAIRHAIENPRTLDMNRVHAQQARAMLDLMIGFTISPLLWKNLAPSLSAGRCQTPALRLVIEREESIDAFQSSRSWGMGATWRRPDGQDSQERLETTMADELEELTYAELLFVLGELVTRWAAELRKDDLGEDDESATETS
jgi:DNA topoisomerase-1